LIPGGHKYDAAPLAISVADCPAQIVNELIETTGNGFIVNINESNIEEQIPLALRTNITEPDAISDTEGVYIVLTNVGEENEPVPFVVQTEEIAPSIKPAKEANCPAQIERSDPALAVGGAGGGLIITLVDVDETHPSAFATVKLCSPGVNPQKVADKEVSEILVLLATSLIVHVPNLGKFVKYTLPTTLEQFG
jgi:hypothetical protein